MKIKQVLLFAFIISLTLNLVSIFRLYQFKDKIEVIALENSINKNLIRDFSKIRAIEFKNEDRAVSPRIRLINPNGDTLLLDEILNEEQKLIYKFNEVSCTACIEGNIRIANMLSEQIGIDNIIFLAHFENYRNFLSYCKLNDILLPIYLIVDYNAFELQVDNNDPCFFIIDESCSVEMFYIPTSTNHELTNSYMRIIENRFIKENLNYTP